MMGLAGEDFFPVLLAVIAVLFIVGGFASISGLSVYDAPFEMVLDDAVFEQGAVFDVEVELGMVSFVADESILIYVDGVLADEISLRDFIDWYGVDYEIEYLPSDVEVVSALAPVHLNLADSVRLDALSRGEHLIEVILSIEGVGSSKSFSVV